MELEFKSDGTICDYCLQTSSNFFQMRFIVDTGKESRIICPDCVIKALDKVFGKPEHKTEEMEKMFRLD